MSYFLGSPDASSDSSFKGVCLDMPEGRLFTLYYNKDDVLIFIIVFGFEDTENGRSNFDTNVIQCLNPAL